jgi:plasmid segregation protein ParM
MLREIVKEIMNRRKCRMNATKLEVIGIDHGWSLMKTVSQVFITGAREIRTEPAVFDDV